MAGSICNPPETVPGWAAYPMGGPPDVTIMSRDRANVETGPESGDFASRGRRRWRGDFVFRLYPFRNALYSARRVQTERRFRVLAAIDVGSNAVRLKVARLLPDASLGTVHKTRDPVRQGEGVVTTGRHKQEVS